MGGQRIQNLYHRKSPGNNPPVAGIFTSSSMTTPKSTKYIPIQYYQLRKGHKAHGGDVFIWREALKVKKESQTIPAQMTLEMERELSTINFRLPKNILQPCLRLILFSNITRRFKMD